ncbi:Retrovirus-related Pol polyprotein like [Argiope bruennichi]|uniref:Retrovirus-related Pol polyprotein like n=1 Tax=Argiope bruennichi TaxID=94029 RepID=A0A8T0EGG2_ARGBR|nr:Retrovirus-related Pol polyprotein like [Argiope bruennichi]
MSTIDLKTGYHQVKIYTPDMDKTAFVCPFGVYRSTRMPFGLKTAPATFQRLIDLFRNGQKVNTLAYLDDIIIMSPTFEQHLEDLRLVFKGLQQLQANRENCHFMCQKVKYLGHLITRSGIEVDPVSHYGHSSTKECDLKREALAVVWTLEKFRGYIEGVEIRVPGSDHQPLKWSSNDIREEQLKDADLKIVETFEQSSKDENFINWTSRGYLMSQGVLYRYAPESDSEEAQLVVPKQEWSDILKAHHDAPTAGHYEEGTYQRISKRYY